MQASPSTDGGDLLTSLPGVSGIRMDGRAIDPVIRGQSQTQLNVLLDDATIHHACPNRQAPSTSDTDGLRWVFDARAMGIDWKIGIDWQNNERDAALQNQSGTVLRLLWPEATIDQRGVFIEGEKSLGMDDVVKAGVRYNHISVEAKRRDEVNMGFSPSKFGRQQVPLRALARKKQKIMRVVLLAGRIV